MKYDNIIVERHHNTDLKFAMKQRARKTRKTSEVEKRQKDEERIKEYKILQRDQGISEKEKANVKFKSTGIECPD